MVSTTVREARLNLSHLLQLVERGEEVVIHRRQKPIARLLSARPASTEGFPDLTSFRAGLDRPPRHRRHGIDEAVRAEREARG